MRGRRRQLVMLLGLVVAASVRADGEEDMSDPPARAELPPEAAPMPCEGVASWYGGKFHGRTTACGETFDENGLTAAHRSLPFGTRICVTNLDNGCQVTIRVTDRGPYHGERILDLSRAAAEHLGFVDKGIARVRFEVVGLPPPRRGLRLGLGPVVAAPPQRPLRLQQPTTQTLAVPPAGARTPSSLAMEVAP